MHSIAYFSNIIGSEVHGKTIAAFHLSLSTLLFIIHGIVSAKRDLVHDFSRFQFL